MSNNFINPTTKNPIIVIRVRIEDFFARLESKTVFEDVDCSITALENSFL